MVRVREAQRRAADGWMRTRRRIASLEGCQARRVPAALGSELPSACDREPADHALLRVARNGAQRGAASRRCRAEVSSLVRWG